MTALLGGGVAYSSTAQMTQDLYYLSDSMSAFGLDYYPYEPAQLVVDTVQGILSHILEKDTIYTPLIGHLVHNYINDYYYRIHVIPDSIDLGNILTEQTRYIEIWNAWFDTKTLNSIDNVSLDELNLVLNKVVYTAYTNTTGYIPITVPHIYNGLETSQLIITIPALGVPSLNGYLQYNFVTELPSTTITGQRVILWPYNTLRTFKESRVYLTDVIQSRSTEQRFALREVPRQTFTYNNIFLSETEYLNAKQLATAISQVAIALPQWTDVVKVCNLSSSQTTIYFSTTNLEFRKDYPIVIWKTWNNWEIQEVLAVYDNYIVLKAGLNTSYSYAYISPIIIGYPDQPIQVTIAEGNKTTGDIQITNIDCFNLSYVDMPMFEGMYIWNRPTTLTNSIYNKYSRQFTLSDTPTGQVLKHDEETYNRQLSILSTIIYDQADLYTVRRLFDAIQGRYGNFWLSAKHIDFQPLSAINIGSSTLTVTYTNLTAYPIKYILISGTDAFKNIIEEAFEVSSVVNNFDGTERMGFVVPATKAFFTIVSVSVLLKVRLDSDVIEYEHLGKGKSLVNVAVKELN